MTDSIYPMTFMGSQIIWHIRRGSDIFSRNFPCLRPRRVKFFLSWNIFPALICSELLKPWIGFHILGLQTSQWIWFLVLTSAFQANLRSNIPCFHVTNSLSILYIWNCSSILRVFNLKHIKEFVIGNCRDESVTNLWQLPSQNTRHGRRTSISSLKLAGYSSLK